MGVAIKLMLVVTFLWISISMLTALPPMFIYCWSCHYSWGIGADDSCKTDPVNASPNPNIIACNLAAHNSCYTQKIDFLNGSEYYFQRGCKLNGTDGCSSTSLTSCTTFCSDETLCNGRTTPLGPTTTPLPEPEFECYECKYTFSLGSDPTEDPCVTDPASVVPPNNVTCNYTAGNECYTTQKNFKASGDISTFERGCQEAAETQCYDDNDYDICDSYCTYNYCNTEIADSNASNQAFQLTPSNSIMWLLLLFSSYWRYKLKFCQ